MTENINIENIDFDEFVDIMYEFNQTNDTNATWKCANMDDVTFGNDYNFTIMVDTKELAVAFKLRYL